MSDGRNTMPLAARIAAKTRGRCYYCGTDLTPDTATHDHMVPKSKKGGSGLSNLVLACRPCNQRKADMSVDEYRERCGVEAFFGEGGERRRVEPLQGRRQRPRSGRGQRPL